MLWGDVFQFPSTNYNHWLKFYIIILSNTSYQMHKEGLETYATTLLKYLLFLFGNTVHVIALSVIITCCGQFNYTAKTKF